MEFRKQIYEFTYLSLQADSEISTDEGGGTQVPEPQKLTLDPAITSFRTKNDTFRLRADHLGHLGYQSKLYTHHQPFPDSGWTWKVPVRSKKTENM